jgi:hypothetical protein
MRTIGLICLIGAAFVVTAPADAATSHSGKNIGAIRQECKAEIGQGTRANKQAVHACVQRKMHGG